MDQAFHAYPECGSRKIQRSHGRNFSGETCSPNGFREAPTVVTSADGAFFSEGLATASRAYVCKRTRRGTCPPEPRDSDQPAQGSERRIMLCIAAVASVLFFSVVAAFVFYTVRTILASPVARPIRRECVPSKSQWGNLPFSSSYDGHLATVPFLQAKPPAQKPAETWAPLNVR